jgi:hypothetical protein
MSKGNDGDACVYNSRCLSDHCHFWRCKGLQKGKDVEPNLSCSDSEDCRFKQYCSNKKCVDRITDDGPCSNDEQCLKNHCTSSNRCWTRIESTEENYGLIGGRGGKTRFSGK